MSAHQLIDSLGLYAGTTLLCFVGGVVPFVINVEIFLVALAAFTTDLWVLWWVVMLASAGQMAAKLLLYGSSAKGLESRWLKPRHRERLEKLQARMAARGGSAYSLLFVSSLVGIPPVYVVSIACGLIRMNVWGFTAVGYVGRLLRFALCVYSPQLIKSWL